MTRRSPSPSGATQTTITAHDTVTRPLSGDVQYQFQSPRQISEATDFIVNVTDEDALSGEPNSRPVSALHRQHVAARGRGHAAHAKLPSNQHALIPGSSIYIPPSVPLRPPSSTQSIVQPGVYSTAKKEGLVSTVPTEAVQGVVAHVRAASASLRRYDVPATSSAISSASKTFARKPQPTYKQVIT